MHDIQIMEKPHNKKQKDHKTHVILGLQVLADTPI